MSTLIIGDFRGKQLQQSHIDNDKFNYDYLLEDSAESSWFKDSASLQLPHLTMDSKNIVIMLGLNDCIYSCVWKTFNIEDIASNYAKATDELIDFYPDLNFYFCSVNPVDADYPFKEYTNGSIPSTVLNAKITQFNNKIKSSCKADFIDCYSYLTKTSFDTRDGIRYKQETCLNILHYINSQLKVYESTAFIPRTTAPIVDSENIIESDLYWVSTSYDGYNPFPIPSVYKKSDGDTLPNCTAYAWGRFYELTGSMPNLSRKNAEQWYLNTSDGYTRSQTPALGAVICWQAGSTTNTDGADGAGHVAIVEQINADGSILISESGWESSWYWRTQTIRKSSDGSYPYGTSGSYKFQGFIYCPTTTAISKEQLCTKNSYGITVEEMKPNAQYVWQYFSARGWTINAVAGLLGNLQVESKMSPAVWESVISGAIINSTTNKQTLNMTAINTYYNNNGRYPGYGLVQWTPYSKYTDWCISNGLDFWDMDSQLQRIDWEAKNKAQWIAKPSKGYDLTFDDFIISKKDAYWLAGAFAFCYERPKASTGSEEAQNKLRKDRGDNANYWYSYLKSLAPIASEDTKPQVDGFRLDKCSATSIAASCITRNIESCHYTLSTGSKNIVSRTLKNSPDEIKIFTIDSNIEPNTDYKLTLELNDRGSENNIKKELSFTTPQDYPDSVKAIKLEPVGKKGKDGIFKLSVTKPSYLGYWSKNKSGYDIQLIINNNCVKTNTIDGIANIASKKFIIKDEFGYECKVGDLFQIGIHVWVTDNKGNKIYDNKKASTSEPIYLLNRSTKAYIKRN